MKGDDPRALIRYALAGLAFTVFLSWALDLVRDALLLIIALRLGGSLLGIVGAIRAVPTAAMLQVLFEELVPEATSE